MASSGQSPYAHNGRAAGKLVGDGAPCREPESHYVNRTGWLRAAVLGANDGIISTASLIVGVAAAAGSRGEILTAAVAGWAAGAMSMAAGEYVSVSSQADSEAADLKREQRALTEHPTAEKARARPHLRGARRQAEARARGGRPAHGQGRARGPRPRRARPDRSGEAESDLGRLALGGLVLGRRRAADPGRFSRRPRDAVVVAVPVAALVFLIALGALGAWAGGAPIVRPALEGRLLGRAGDGGDGGHRRAGRQGHLAAGGFRSRGQFSTRHSGAHAGRAKVKEVFAFPAILAILTKFAPALQPNQGRRDRIRRRRRRQLRFPGAGHHSL